MSTLLDRLREYQDQLGPHRAGTLSAGPLERIEWYFDHYFKDRPVRSVETGCGASTVILANRAQHHTAYCYDDRSEGESSVNYALNFPEFPRDRVKWVFGPTQKTIFESRLDEPVDFVLIDGPHGYPFPELEYFAFYKFIRTGGILVIDDIHIPTINNLYQFLLQDDGWRCHGVTLATAFFQRTDRPAFNMEGDDWWLQRYNVQAFPAIKWDDPVEGVNLPITLNYDNGGLAAFPELLRGFSTYGNKPVSEGDLSLIELRLAQKAPARVRIKLDMKPVCVESRPGTSVMVSVDNNKIGEWNFNDSQRRTIEFDAPTGSKSSLTIEFWNSGLSIANDLSGWKNSWYDARRPNFLLNSVTIADADQGVQETVALSRIAGSVASFDYEGQTLNFFVNRPHDSVEIFHSQGRFYEIGELETIRAHIPVRSRVLDVGAHVGNHSVYFAKIIRAAEVVAIEPNPMSIQVLRLNCLLNDLPKVDLSNLGIALGNTTSAGTLQLDSESNTGGAKFVAVEGGSVPLRVGDEVFPDRNFDFIKVDVEGMEIEVLKGLAKLINRSQPILFVEVTDANDAEFCALLGEWGYGVAWSSQMYSGLKNYLMKPKV